MYADIKNYFYQKVIPEYRDYMDFRGNNLLDNNSDIRIALNCANGIYHLREHLPKDIKKSRIFFSELCGDYDLLGDIVNVSKHGVIDRNAPQISNSNNFMEKLFVTTYEDELGEYRVIVKEVMVQLDNGTKRLLSEILTNCVNMWYKYLFDNKLLIRFEKFQISTEIPKRTNDQLITNVMRGLTFGPLEMTFQRYNYDKKSIEKIDLTGSKVEMKLRLPPNANHYDIELKSPDPTKKNIKWDVILTDEEVKELGKLNNDEKIKYVHARVMKQSYGV